MKNNLTLDHSASIASRLVHQSVTRLSNSTISCLSYQLHEPYRDLYLDSLSGQLSCLYYTINFSIQEHYKPAIISSPPIKKSNEIQNMKNTQTITPEAVEQVQLFSKNPATAVRVWKDDYAVNEGKDQGDLLLWMSNADISKMEKVKVVGEIQLAPGNTLGSRHTIDTEYVDVYKPENFGQFVNVGTREKPAGYIMGYLLNVKKRTELKHPEHPWHELCVGLIQTAGQTDARTLQWSKD